MKNNLSKRLIALALAGAMVFSLAACGGSESQTNGGAELDIVLEEGEVTYPLETEAQLSIWTGAQMQPANGYASWTESPFHTGLAEKTGIDIDWKFLVAGGNAAQAYNLLWVDEEIPDMVYYTTSVGDGLQYIEDGLIWDLTEYLPKYAPNFWEYINRPENALEKKCITTDDGRFFKIPAVIEGEYNATYMGFAIRQDWLDECGLPMPVTIEDLENVLVAFNDKYGAKLGFRWHYAKKSGFIASAFDGLGFLDGFKVNDEQKIVLPEACPEYEQLLATVADWTDRGLFDEDSITMDDASVRTKALTGDIGVTIVPMSQLTLLITDAEKEGNGANWVPMNYIRVEEGAPLSITNTQAANITNFGTLFTKSMSEDELKLALRWSDYAFTEEGIMYWNYGEEGTSYTLDENGKPQLTELITNDALGVSEALKRYALTSGSAPTIQLASVVADRNHATTAEGPNIWTENSNARKHAIPPIGLSTEENDIYTEKFAAINTYMAEEVAKFVTCARPLDEYEDFVQELYGMGLQEALDAYQAAYDRFLAK